MMKSNNQDSCHKRFKNISRWIALLLVCWTQISTVEGYPVGVAIPGFACMTMNPSHTTDPQTGDSPYTISLSTSSYAASSTVSVTLSGSQPFRGFMIQARQASGQNTDQIGTFTNVPSEAVSPCDGVLAHSNNAEKDSITLTWTAPETPAGNLVFRVTFVRQEDTYWVGLESDELQNSAPQVTDSDDCGTSLGCFSKCSGTCDFHVSWNEDGNFGVYTLQTVTSEANPWMAIGFSADSAMGSDSVSGCRTAADGTVSIFNGLNGVRSAPSIFQDNDVTLSNSRRQGSIFSCTIRRPKAGAGQRFDITQSFFLFFARGNTDNSIILYHQPENRFSSTQRYSVTDRPDENLNAPSTPGSFTLPSDCGVTRGCLSRCPDNCDSFVTWAPSGTNGVYSLTLETSSSTTWMALGFSSDQNMGNDSVIGCYADSNRNVVLFSGRNEGRSEPRRFTDNEVTLMDSSFVGNTFSCTFRRPNAANADGTRVDATQRWFYLFATGSTIGSGQTLTLDYHGDNKYFSGAAFAVSDLANAAAESVDRPLIRWHGSLMICSWIFFASVGIIIARYFKPVWTVNMCKEKVWFQIHRTCMILVLCTTAAGFVIIFVEVKDLSDLTESEPDDKYLRAHPYMGIAVTALTILNPLMALIRPHPGTKHRPIFNWAHWFVGTSAHILAVITIFFGVQLQGADGPDYLVYILAGYVGWQVLVELTLELLQCCGREEDKSETYNLDNVNAPRTAHQESGRTLLIKRWILVFHIFVVAALTATLVGVLAIGEEELED